MYIYIGLYYMQLYIGLCVYSCRKTAQCTFNRWW